MIQPQTFQQADQSAMVDPNTGMPIVTPGAVAPISAIPPPIAPVAPVTSQVPSTFSPRAQATAANIYGTPIDGSFGRQMNQPV